MCVGWGSARCSLLRGRGEWAATVASAISTPAVSPAFASAAFASAAVAATLTTAALTTAFASTAIASAAVASAVASADTTTHTISGQFPQALQRARVGV